LDPPVRGAAAFHCQQAVEKLLKGFLVLAGKRSRKTHSLAELGAAAQESFPEISDLVAAAKDWSRWAIDFRYPKRRGRIKPAPDEDALRRALFGIDELATRLRAANPEHATRNP
jgi:HEPN domain-containing protein